MDERESWKYVVVKTKEIKEKIKDIVEEIESTEKKYLIEASCLILVFSKSLFGENCNEKSLNLPIGMLIADIQVKN